MGQGGANMLRIHAPQPTTQREEETDPGLEFLAQVQCSALGGLQLHQHLLRRGNPLAAPSGLDPPRHPE
jgi:hypothetical protein